MTDTNIDTVIARAVAEFVHGKVPIRVDFEISQAVRQALSDAGYVIVPAKQWLLPASVINAGSKALRDASASDEPEIFASDIFVAMISAWEQEHG